MHTHCVPNGTSCCWLDYMWHINNTNFSFLWYQKVFWSFAHFFSLFYYYILRCLSIYLSYDQFHCCRKIPALLENVDEFTFLFQSSVCCYILCGFFLPTPKRFGSMIFKINHKCIEPTEPWPKYIHKYTNIYIHISLCRNIVCPLSYFNLWPFSFWCSLCVDVKPKINEKYWLIHHSHIKNVCTLTVALLLLFFLFCYIQHRTTLRVIHVIYTDLREALDGN